MLPALVTLSWSSHFLKFFFFFFFGVHPFPRLCQLQHPNIRLCFSYRPYLLSPPALPLLLTYIYDVFLSLSTTFHKYFQTSRPSVFFFYENDHGHTLKRHTHIFLFFNFFLVKLLLSPHFNVFFHQSLISYL